MKNLRTALLWTLAIFGSIGEAQAITSYQLYQYTGEVDYCSAFCSQINALTAGGAGQDPSSVTGDFLVDVGLNDTFVGTDIGDINFSVFNPNEPVDTSTDLQSANPLVFSGAGLGGSITGSGSTDGTGAFNSGSFAVDFDVDLGGFLGNTGMAFAINLVTGVGVLNCVTGTACAFLGGDPRIVQFAGAFEVVPIPLPAAAWLIAPAFALLAPWVRRRPAAR